MRIILQWTCVKESAFILKRIGNHLEASVRIQLGQVCIMDVYSGCVAANGLERMRWTFWGSTGLPLQGPCTQPRLLGIPASEGSQPSPSVGIAPSHRALPFLRAKPAAESTRGHDQLTWGCKGPATLPQSGTGPAPKLPVGSAGPSGHPVAADFSLRLSS